MSLDRFCYVSRAVRPMSTADLEALCFHAAQQNSIHGRTGILLYGQGHFLQVIEGGTFDIVSLYGKICRDHRHEEVALLTCETQVRRRFPDWSLGLLNLDASRGLARDVLEHTAGVIREMPLTARSCPAVHMVRQFQELIQGRCHEQRAESRRAG